MKNQIFILLICFVVIFSYDAERAISYANTYCDKRNPDFGDYSNDFGDSPNFISQCLIAGGEDLSAYERDQYGSIISTDVLVRYLNENGWNSQSSSSIPDNFPPGGIIIDNRYAMIAITKTTYAAHSNDKCGAQIYDGTHTYYWK